MRVPSVAIPTTAVAEGLKAALPACQYWCWRCRTASETPASAMGTPLLARLRAARDASSLESPASIGEVGSSESRAERNRATMRALFEANVQLRRDLAAQTLNS